MSAYKDKARKNLKVADYFLNKDGQECAIGVHFYYFAVFLIIKYILNHFMGVSYASQEQMSNAGDSHKVLSDVALKQLAQEDCVNANDYFTDYNKINFMRKKADYLPKLIPQKQLQEIGNHTRIFLSRLSQLYKFAV